MPQLFLSLRTSQFTQKSCNIYVNLYPIFSFFLPNIKFLLRFTLACAMISRSHFRDGIILLQLPQSFSFAVFSLHDANQSDFLFSSHCAYKTKIRKGTKKLNSASRNDTIVKIAQ